MFYSKFSYRHYMAELLMYVTKFEPYVTSLQQVVEDGVEGFVRFINMMLNDVIFCLDDALLKLQVYRMCSPVECVVICSMTSSSASTTPFSNSRYSRHTHTHTHVY